MLMRAPVGRLLSIALLVVAAGATRARAQQSGTLVKVSPDAPSISAVTGVAVAFSAAGSKSATPGKQLLYQWQFGDGARASGESALHAYTTAGTYTATLTVIDGGRGTNRQWAVTVKPRASITTESVPKAASAAMAAAASARGAPTAVIKGPAGTHVDSVAVFDGTASTSVPAGRSLTYQWNFGDGSTGAGPTVAHRYQSANAFTITLVVTDGTAQSAPATAVIRVAPSTAAKRP